MLLSDQLRAFLAEPRFAVVATIGEDGLPQQTVLWYELQGDELMMNTADGRVKTRNLRRDSRISFCIEDGYRYVTIAGTARLNDDQAVAQADIAALAHRYHDAAHAERIITNFRKQHRITLRVPIEQVVAHGFDQ